MKKRKSDDSYTLRNENSLEKENEFSIREKEIEMKFLDLKKETTELNNIKKRHSEKYWNDDERIKREQKECETRKKNLDIRKENLDTREKDIELKEQKLITETEQLKIKEQALGEYENHLYEYESENKKDCEKNKIIEKEIELKYQSICEKEEKLNSKELNIISKEKELELKHQSICEKEEKLNWKELNISSKEKDIEFRENSILEKEKSFKKIVFFPQNVEMSDISELLKCGIVVCDTENMSEGFDIFITKLDSKKLITPRTLLAIISGKVFLSLSLS
jgi:uncharacterized protein (DUF3084 family)